MPQTKQAAKELRKIKVRTQRNDYKRNNLEYLFSNFKKAIQIGDKAKATELSGKLIKSLDKATKTNLLKKNTVARKKSRLMKKLNTMEKK